MHAKLCIQYAHPGKGQHCIFETGCSDNAHVELCNMNDFNMSREYVDTIKNTQFVYYSFKLTSEQDMSLHVNQTFKRVKNDFIYLDYSQRFFKKANH